MPFTVVAANVTTSPTIHACAVLVGARAILIRGPAGSGKSRLALALIEAAAQRRIPFARLVADDRVALEHHHGRLIARAPQELAGQIEVRGLGIRRLDHEPVAVVGLVVDLAAADAQRLPSPSEREAEIAGLRLPRLAVASGIDPVPVLLAHLNTPEAGV
jgi:HPr kinase/phosphorylase